jgi:hypothetical protein
VKNSAIFDFVILYMCLPRAVTKTTIAPNKNYGA